MVGTTALHRLQHDTIVELYDLDLTRVVPGQWFHFTNLTYYGFNLQFNFKVYTPIPIKSGNFALNGTGQPEVGSLTISNLGLGFMPLVRQYNDLAGCRLIRRKVFYRNLDFQEFANGNAILEESHWYLDRIEYNKLEIRWDLIRLRDLGNFKLPGRVVAADLCGFKYRRWTAAGWDYTNTSECGYQGVPLFDLNDNPTIDPSKDVCSHTLKACELRNNSRRFGGFPGAGQINYSKD